MFSTEVRDLIEFWIVEIEEIGYGAYIKTEFSKMLNDHPLESNRQNQRSITLNQTGGRLIYETFKKRLVVKINKITPDHDYN